MKIIMYHYVREQSNEFPHFNYLDINIFRKQLDYFQKESHFLSKTEYFEAIESGENKNGCVLTFDDGLIDHYSFVLSELKSRGLWGLFYIPTRIYTEATVAMLGVHRIHCLKGKYGSSAILKEALNIIDEGMLDQENIANFDKDIYTFTNYEEDDKKLRRLFNYYIKYDYRDQILDILMKKYFVEEKLKEDFYLTVEQIKELENQGNIIGSHTVSHKVLSRLSYNEQVREIKDSFLFLESIVKITKHSFCFPYGYASSYNQTTLSILSELNVHNAVVFDNQEQGNNIKRLELSRIDCNKFMKV